MNLYVGTSGYSYKEWKGLFYPEKLPAKDMLRYYGQHLPSVEINNTFYRMPRRSVLESWADQVPDGFRFAIKASRRITHFSQLVDCDEAMSFLLGNVTTLGVRLGCVFFQLPPYLRKDVDRLAGFLTLLTPDVRAAFEFRHDSWFAEDVYAVLREHNCALCGADTDDGPLSFDTVSTADWGYVRLRREAYAPADLDAWAEHLVAQPWEDAFVFVKHEESGPKIAADLLSAAGVPVAPPSERKPATRKRAAKTAKKTTTKTATKTAKRTTKKTTSKSPKSEPRSAAAKRAKPTSVSTKKSSERQQEAR